MKEKKQWLIRLFIILFSVSVSVAVLPCGIITTHGLFGEITSSTITNDDNSSFQESRVIENRRQIKGINIYNIKSSHGSLVRQIEIFQKQCILKQLLVLTVTAIICMFIGG